MFYPNSGLEVQRLCATNLALKNLIAFSKAKNGNQLIDPYMGLPLLLLLYGVKFLDFFLKLFNTYCKLAMAYEKQPLLLAGLIGVL